MSLVLTDPVLFVRLILSICETFALLSFSLLFLARVFDSKEKPHWVGRLQTLALWHLLVPPVLYGLQFILPALCIYVLGLLLMMISLHILREWFIDRDNRWKVRTKNVDVEKVGCLPYFIVKGQFDTCFGLMSLAIYNILLFYGVDPLLNVVVSIGGTAAWMMLDFIVMNLLWQRGKSFKQRELQEWQGWVD